MMNAKWSTIALVGCFMLLLVACNQISSPAPSDKILLSPSATLSIVDVQTESTSTLPIQESQKDNTPMAQPSTPPSSTGLESLVEKAKEDLAKRLSTSVSQIDLIEAKDVVWPDSSLGCSQSGMAYAEVLTPGFLVRLEAQGQAYEYHTDIGYIVILCDSAFNDNSPLKDTDKSVDDGWPNQTKDKDVIIITPTPR